MPLVSVLCFAALGIKSMTWHMSAKCSTTDPTPFKFPIFFVLLYGDIINKWKLHICTELSLSNPDLHLLRVWQQALPPWSNCSALQTNPRTVTTAFLKYGLTMSFFCPKPTLTFPTAGFVHWILIADKVKKIKIENRFIKTHGIKQFNRFFTTDTQDRLTITLNPQGSVKVVYFLISFNHWAFAL